MELSEFRIGEAFWFERRKWRCTDIGTRTVVAIRVDRVDLEMLGGQSCQLDEATATAEGWLDGPPYGVAEHVFDEDEIPGCSQTVDGDADHG